MSEPLDSSDQSELVADLRAQVEALRAEVDRVVRELEILRATFSAQTQKR